MSDSECRQVTAFPDAHDIEARFAAIVCADPARFQLVAPPPPRRSVFRSLNFLAYDNRTASRTAPLWFALFIAAQLGVVWSFVAYTFPDTWNAQISSGPTAIVLTGLICSLALCFGEYVFHRYLLHIETVRFLRSLCSSHRQHHKLTSITFDDRTGRVRSRYPITSAEADDQSTFPPWALIPFFAFFTPFLAPAAFSFPDVPLLIGGYAAIAVAHFLYETIHVLHHQPFERFWQPRLRHPVLGSVWRWLYGFHLGHHANYTCNLNVAGFFGVPLADFVFGTYRRPEPLLIDGVEARKEAARRLTTAPRWPIAWLDRVVFKRRRWMVKRP